MSKPLLKAPPLLWALMALSFHYVTQFVNVKFAARRSSLNLDLIINQSMNLLVSDHKDPYQ